MNKNTKKVCKNVTLTLSVLLTSCGGGGGGAPSHSPSSSHFPNNPEAQVDFPQVENNSIASEQETTEDAENTPPSSSTDSSPTVSIPDTNSSLDHFQNNAEIQVDSPISGHNSVLPEKDSIEGTEDNDSSLLLNEDAITSSPMPLTPNTNVTPDRNTNNNSEETSDAQVDSSNVEHHSMAPEKETKQEAENHSGSSSSNETASTPSPAPSTPNTNNDSEDTLKAEVVDSAKVENDLMVSEKDSASETENNKDTSLPNKDAISSTMPHLPNSEEKSKSDSAKVEHHSMTPEKETKQEAENHSGSSSSNETASTPSPAPSTPNTNNNSEDTLKAEADSTKVENNSMAQGKETKQDAENHSGSSSSNETASTPSPAPSTPNANNKSEEALNAQVDSTQVENNSMASEQGKTEDAKNSSTPTLSSEASTHSSQVASASASASETTTSSAIGKIETSENNKPSTPINNTNSAISEQNQSLAANFKGNFLGVEEEKKQDLYHSDESKIYHVGILDSFFYKSENLKKSDNTSRLVDINQKGNHDEDKRHHGTFVATIFAKNNQLSDIYGQSTFRSGARVFDTGNGVYQVSHPEPTAEHYKNLYDKGVRIFNNSYGSIWTENAVEDSYLEKLAEYAEKDSIFVWAAGNEKADRASLEAHYADKKPKIKNGWITAAAVEDDVPQQGKKLADYSNKVGDKVKNWGIAAQGNWTIDLPKGECTLKNSNGCTRKIIGTSFAAPTVSATVANVWNKFPWMDNHLVVVTVLSTANKPNEREQTTGPDETFGWGLLDNDRAIRGPGRFDKRLLTDRDTDDLLTVNLRNMHYTDTNKLTWANPIAGDAGIRKKGNGTLYFSGENSYEGDTVIEDGAIQISKPLTKSKVKIKPQGTFIAKNDNSTVTVGAEQNNSYELHNDGGTLGVYGKGLEIKGNYKGQNGAKVAIDIDQAKLKVTGSLDIGNNGYIIADIENIFLLNSQKEKENVIVEADKIENYNGDYKVSSELSKYVSIEDFKATDKEVKVKYKRNTTKYVFKEIDYTPTVSEVNAGNLLDTRLDDLSEKAEKNPTALSANTSRSVARIMSADSVELPKIVKSLSGEIYASSQNIFVKQNRLFNHTLSSRIASLMNAEKSGVWLDSLHTKYNLHQAGYSQGNVTTTGTQIGIDGKLSNNLTLGAAFFNGKSSAQFGERVGNIESKSNSLSLYGSYDFNQFYLSGRLGGSRVNNNIKRDVIDQRVESSYQSNVYNIYAELGKMLQLSNISINPFLAGEFSQISRGQFNENAEFGIRSDKTNYNQKHVVAGLRGTVKLDRIHLMANLSHSFALNAQDFNFDASFKDSERKLSIKGVKQPKHSTFAELGISYEISKHFTLQSKYSLTMQGAKKENNVFHLGAVYNF